MKNLILIVLTILASIIAVLVAWEGVKTRCDALAAERDIWKDQATISAAKLTDVMQSQLTAEMREATEAMNCDTQKEMIRKMCCIDKGPGNER